MHSTNPKIPEDQSDMNAWAESFSKLQYDRLAEFVHCFASKVSQDAFLDMTVGRTKLSEKLILAAKYLDDAWEICRSFEDSDSDLEDLKDLGIKVIANQTKKLFDFFKI